MAEEVLEKKDPVPEEKPEEEKKEEKVEELSDERPWEEPEEVIEPVQEQVDLEAALEKAKLDYMQNARGRSPEAEKIEQLEQQIAALRSTTPQEERVALGEAATVDDLLKLTDERISKRMESFFRERELQAQEEQKRQMALRAEQDQTVELQIKVLRDNKVINSKEEEKQVLQTCIDYGSTDLFKAAKIWSKEKKLKELEERGKNQKKVESKKSVMAKLGRSTPVSSAKAKINVRTATMEDIAAAAARR